MEIFGVPKDSAVGKLVDSIQAVCKEKGYTFSRWQTNKGRYQTTISYAVHTGERASQYRLQEGILASGVLGQSEGKTEKSEAYRVLYAMLNKLSK